MDIIIIINNKGIGIIGGEGLDGVQKIVQAVSQCLYVKLNTALFSFFQQMCTYSLYDLIQEN